MVSPPQPSEPCGTSAWVIEAEHKIEAAKKELAAEQEAMRQARHLDGLYELELRARLDAIEERRGMESQLVLKAMEERRAQMKALAAAEAAAQARKASRAAKEMKDNEANAKAAPEVAWTATMAPLIYEVASECWDKAHREATRTADAVEHAALAHFEVRTEECRRRLTCLAQQMPAALARGSLDVLLRMQAMQATTVESGPTWVDSDVPWMHRVLRGELDEVCCGKTPLNLKTERARKRNCCDPD